MDASTWKKVKDLYSEVADRPEAADELLSQAEPAVRSEVARLLKNMNDAAGFIEEPAVVSLGVDGEGEDVWVGKTIDDYVISRQIGSGGMGSVYLAEQKTDELSHRVALKLIKRGMDTALVLKRFVRERQILADLEHPNIARFLDGGSTPDGLPYFVMEYVEGLPIREFCETRGLGTDERLRLFRKVCSAVSFAHQNLIVHRDLKPSNILVSDDGEPKLLDFGIAKLLNPDWSDETGEATATMFRVMTPDYASPEQLQGMTVTTASDVYSLGVVLYEMLTGRRPYKLESRSPEGVAREISTQEPIKPSSAVSREPADTHGNRAEATNEAAVHHRLDARDLVGDLDNIILKSLQKEPARRYQSAAELSEDIRRHLVGLPVTATADTIGYRVSKFVRRHRTGVATAALVALVLLATTSITAWQAYRANQEKAKAEHRFNQVRKLANLVIFDYHDGIEKLAGSTAIREKMVKDAVDYLDNLSAEGASDPELLGELAAAYQKVGDVQGNPYLPNLGDQDGALASYEKGQAIRSRLAGLFPDDAKVRLDLELSYEKLGEILWAKGDSAKARDNYLQALAICEDLAAKSALTLEQRYALLRVNQRIAQTLEQEQKNDEAITRLRTAASYGETLIGQDPTNPKFRRGLAIAYLKIGDNLHLTKRFREAVDIFRSSLDSFGPLYEADRTNVNAKRDYTLALARFGAAQLELGDHENALISNQRTVELQEELVKADPQNLQAPFDLADTVFNLGDNYDRMGRSREARVHYLRALETYEAGTKKIPDYSQASSHFGQACYFVAKFEMKMGERQAAIETYRRAIQILEGEKPRKEIPNILAQAYEGMGDALAQAGAKEKAAEMFAKSIETWQSLKDAGKLSEEDARNFDKLRQRLASGQG